MQALVADSKSYTPPFNVINTLQDKSIQSVKVIELIRERMNARRERFYSIEVSYTADLSLNFNDFTVQPLFTSVTWLKDSAELENPMKTEPAVQLINAITSTATVLHVTCYKLTETTLEKLIKAKRSNILALRGDIVVPNQKFEHAIDLVTRIKHLSPETSLAVAGYPDMHPESTSSESDIKYLKEKVEAGADFIITQPCFSSSTIIEFIGKCRKVGITVPIVPGIYVPSTYYALLFMCNLCKISVPTEQFVLYKMLKDDPKAFQDYAVEKAVQLLNDLFSNDEKDATVTGIHFFTLNDFELMERVIGHFDFK